MGDLLDLSDDCLREQPCSHGMKTELQNFHSTKSWEKHFGHEFGLEVGGAWGDFAASVSASQGTAFEKSAVEERTYTLLKMAKRKGCYEIKTNCLMDKSKLNPLVTTKMTQIQSMTNGGMDEDSMKLWSEHFLGLIGTHVVVASEHGAKVTQLVSVQNSMKASSDCLRAKACASAKWAEYVNFSICGGHNNCDMREDNRDEIHDECVAKGGASDSHINVCDPKCSQPDFDEFLNGGDLESGNSAISFTFMPWHKLLMYMDMWKESKILKKALEYHSCSGNRKWIKGANGQHSCQCAVTCKNGGKLIKDTCTCECKGDLFHGFKGVECEEDFGSCQAGPNTGNKNAASKCTLDNVCASGLWNARCKNTEVCCLTDFKGQCCPFGSSCDCGANSCKCVAPRELPAFMLV